MKELVCIVCPMGCSLAVDEGVAGAEGKPAWTITCNRCPRGALYAQEEMLAPKRVVTATCACAVEGSVGESRSPMRVPVKTSAPCPREKIPALLADIYNVKIKLPVKTGDLVIPDWNSSGIDIIVTRSIA